MGTEQKKKEMTLKLMPAGVTITADIITLLSLFVVLVQDYSHFRKQTHFQTEKASFSSNLLDVWMICDFDIVTVK